MATAESTTNLLQYETPAEPSHPWRAGAAALACGAIALTSLAVQWANAADGDGIVGGVMGLFSVPVLGFAAIVVGAWAAGFAIPRLPAWAGLGAGIATMLGWLGLLVYLVGQIQCC